MNEEIKLEPKHILCVNWYIFTELWRNEYREIWNQNNKGKFRLESKVPVQVVTEGKISTINFYFFELFKISHSYYDKIMHGEYSEINNLDMYTNDNRKIKNLSKLTHLYPYVFNGEECLIPLEEDNNKKYIYEFTIARFESHTTLDYKEKTKPIKRLIDDFSYLTDMENAISFIKTRGTVIPEKDLIKRNKIFIDTTRYDELLKADITSLTDYKKSLRDHLAQVNSCIIYKKNT